MTIVQKAKDASGSAMMIKYMSGLGWVKLGSCSLLWFISGAVSFFFWIARDFCASLKIQPKENSFIPFSCVWVPTILSINTILERAGLDLFMGICLFLIGVIMFDWIERDNYPSIMCDSSSTHLGHHFLLSSMSTGSVFKRQRLDVCLWWCTI